MVSYFRARFASAYYENVLSIKASPIFQLTENTVQSHSFRGVTVLCGRYQLTSYEKLLILLSLGVSQVRAAVRINVPAKTFLRDVTPNKMGTEV